MMEPLGLTVSSGQAAEGDNQRWYGRSALGDGCAWNYNTQKKIMQKGTLLQTYVRLIGDGMREEKPHVRVAAIV
jgi:hypothetical protein